MEVGCENVDYTSALFRHSIKKLNKVFKGVIKLKKIIVLMVILVFFGCSNTDKKDSNLEENISEIDNPIQNSYDDELVEWDENGINRSTRTKYDKEGYDINLLDKEGYDKEGYDKEGYDKYGYDKEGYDIYGYDRYGWNRDTSIRLNLKTKTLYAMNGYDREGYNEEGYDKEGYNREGYDREGYDRDGWNKDISIRLNSNTQTLHDMNGYDREGYNEEGYDKEGYDRDGWSKDESKKFNSKTYTLYDKNGYDREGYDREGWNRKGINKETRAIYDENGYDAEGYDREGWSKEGINKYTGTLYNKAGYNIYGYTKNEFEILLNKKHIKSKKDGIVTVENIVKNFPRFSKLKSETSNEFNKRKLSKRTEFRNNKDNYYVIETNFVPTYDNEEKKWSFDINELLNFIYRIDKENTRIYQAENSLGSKVNVSKLEVMKTKLAFINYFNLDSRVYFFDKVDEAEKRNKSLFKVRLIFRIPILEENVVIDHRYLRPDYDAPYDLNMEMEIYPVILDGIMVLYDNQKIWLQKKDPIKFPFSFNSSIAEGEEDFIKGISESDYENWLNIFSKLKEKNLNSNGFRTSSFTYKNVFSYIILINEDLVEITE